VGYSVPTGDHMKLKKYNVRYLADTGREALFTSVLEHENRGEQSKHFSKLSFECKISFFLNNFH
jgi:hypothetical protein